MLRPFLLVGVGLYIRMKIAESPVFLKVKEQASAEKSIPKMPILEVIKHPKNILLAMGARFAENGLFYIFTAFALTYVSTQLKVDRVIALNGLLIAAGVNIFLGPLWGLLSDKLGRRPVYIYGAVACGVLAFPFFWMLQTRQTGMIALVLITVVSVGFMKETANSGIGPEVQPSVPVPSPLESPPLVIAAPAIAALPLIVP